MAEPNLASSTTSVKQKGQNAQKVNAQYSTINEYYSNQWQADREQGQHSLMLLPSC